MALLESKVAEIAHVAIGRDAVKMLSSRPSGLKKQSCYNKVVQHFDSRCLQRSSNTYALEQLHVFANLCESGIGVKEIRKAINVVCI